MGMIMSVGSVQQLERVVSEHRDAMHEIHLSAAFSKLAKLPMLMSRGLDLMRALEVMLSEPKPPGAQELQVDEDPQYQLVNVGHS